MTLRWTSDITQSPYACSDMYISYWGGSPPYTLSVITLEEDKDLNNDGVVSTGSIVGARLLFDDYRDTSYNWTVDVDAGSAVMFLLRDNGSGQLMSKAPLPIKSNNRGNAEDTWCHMDDDDDGDGSVSVSISTVSISPTDPSNGQYARNDSLYGSYSYSSTSAATSSSSPNSESDHGSVYQEELNIHRLKTIESVLGGLLAVMAIALIACLFFFFRLRRRYSRIEQQLSLEGQGGAGSTSKKRGQTKEKKSFGGIIGRRRKGDQPIENEKGEFNVRTNQHNLAAGITGNDDLLDLNSQDLASAIITPNALRPDSENPFDDNYAASNDALLLGDPRRPDTAKASRLGRMSVSSFASTVPSSRGALSIHSGITNKSGVSTEFYHRTKASTMAPGGTLGPNGTFNSRMASSAGTVLRSRPSDGSTYVGSPVSKLGPSSHGTAGREVAVHLQPHRNGGATSSLETVLIPITRTSTQSTSSNALSASPSGSDIRPASSDYQGSEYYYHPGRPEHSPALTSTSTMDDDQYSFSNVTFSDPNFARPLSFASAASDPSLFSDERRVASGKARSFGDSSGRSLHTSGGEEGDDDMTELEGGLAEEDETEVDVDLDAESEMMSMRTRSRDSEGAQSSASEGVIGTGGYDTAGFTQLSSGNGSRPSWTRKILKR